MAMAAEESKYVLEEAMNQRQLDVVLQSMLQERRRGGG